jgi:Domain of unknown function (DU1801)
MTKNKTIETQASVKEFLEKIQDSKRRQDCTKLIELISQSTALEPKMWGASIIGFGSYHYKYASGREDDATLVGVSPRASAIVLYLFPEFQNKAELLQKLGKHKTGKGCIYINKLEDIDTGILLDMVQESIACIKTLYPN